MGILHSAFNESLPPKSKFSVDDIPDMTGKVMIVTGAAGIGKETIKALLNHNARVYVAARSEEKANATINELKQSTGKEALFLKLDLADLPGVKRAVEEFLSKETELHVLFNNAGVMNPPVKQVTSAGYDMQFGTNTLGHFYFTKLLLPVLISTAKSSPDKHVRVVNTSSLGHLMVDKLHFDTFKDSDARLKFGTVKLYSQSKLGNVVFARELAERYGDQGIVSTSLNPGNIRSELQRHLPGLGAMIIRAMCYPTPNGALTQLWAGTSVEGAGFNGKYLIPWARVGECSQIAKDPAAGKKLWDWLEAEVQGI